LGFQILENEQETWEVLVAYVRKYGVDCDLWVGKTVRPQWPKSRRNAETNH
jgi:hypothetical protein